MMIPNENFLKYFGDVELLKTRLGEDRSSCLRIDTFLVIRKISEEYNLPHMTARYLGAKDAGLFLDLAAYSIITEGNAAQYYPNYAYNHPLFTERMIIYSDSKISDSLAQIKDDQRVGDIELAEFGHPKDDKGLPLFNC